MNVLMKRKLLLLTPLAALAALLGASSVFATQTATPSSVDLGAIKSNGANHVATTVNYAVSADVSRSPLTVKIDQDPGILVWTADHGTCPDSSTPLPAGAYSCTLNAAFQVTGSVDGNYRAFLRIQQSGSTTVVVPLTVDLFPGEAVKKKCKKKGKRRAASAKKKKCKKKKH
jgi:hypothetical protein